jgi:hypothetical protein
MWYACPTTSRWTGWCASAYSKSVEAVDGRTRLFVPSTRIVSRDGDGQL